MTQTTTTTTPDIISGHALAELRDRIDPGERWIAYDGESGEAIPGTLYHALHAIETHDGGDYRLERCPAGWQVRCSSLTLGWNPYTHHEAATPEAALADYLADAQRVLREHLSRSGRYSLMTEEEYAEMMRRAAADED